MARYWTGLWGRLSKRDLPEALPAKARAILESLRCDLVDDEDVQPGWLCTLADSPNEGEVRPAIRSLLESSYELA